MAGEGAAHRLGTGEKTAARASPGLVFFVPGGAKPASVFLHSRCQTAHLKFCPLAHCRDDHLLIGDSPFPGDFFCQAEEGLIIKT